MGAIDEMLPVALMDCIQVTHNITDLILLYNILKYNKCSK